jgi:hypothetical protein
VSQAFIVDDRALVDRTELVVDGIGQSLSADANLNAPVGILEYLNVFADQAPVGRRVSQKIQLTFIVQRQRVGNFAQLSPAENKIKFFVASKSAMRVVRLARLLTKPGVVVFDEMWHEGIGGLDACDALKPQLFDKTILESRMCTFDTTLGCRGIGANTT